MNDELEDFKFHSGVKEFRNLIEDAIYEKNIDKIMIDLIFREIDRVYKERDKLASELFSLRDFIDLCDLNGDYFRFLQIGDIE
ncbi:hypothetical protein LEP1GSC047_0960 [Leptospira inadai serovar Lyme str. 10]|uniref:Uncharacterized protein n=2 Tax=Leptospira inadai serovar Lyme TaxID=293084 RepID=V6HS70_9LEPT|nr:hypothetical protein [Leptospira inadai]EQA35424.1 hypothetical protein LEP1GSC047_0960 [Leptospira inadai serovar Lyme str. 10]PNV71498.1 hypothetical protein BES34_021410 [Leptospira inadai serovar Lyme]